VRQLEDERAEGRSRGRRPSGRQREAAEGAEKREPPNGGQPDRGRPIGLAEGQLGGAAVTRARQSIPVLAWVPYTGGSYHQIRAWAGEWTRKAVHLRWRDDAGAWDLWVHADDVQRASTRPPGGALTTMRPDSRVNPRGIKRRPGPA
jgi:hypothetical protein